MYLKNISIISNKEFDTPTGIKEQIESFKLSLFNVKIEKSKLYKILDKFLENFVKISNFELTHDNYEESIQILTQILLSTHKNLIHPSFDGLNEKYNKKIK